MSVRLPMRSIYTILLAGLLGPMAHAQAPSRDVVTGDGGDASSVMERMADATPREKAEYVMRTIQELLQIQRSMQGMLKTAPECVESRLVLLNSLIEVALVIQNDMTKHQLEGNTALADMELRKVAVAASVARSLLAQALACAAADAPDGQTQTSYAYVDTLPPDVVETTAAIIEDPPEASPFQ